jgi:hypothetical protein
MAFTDDLAGLPRAGQIALVQAVAREHGDELGEADAAQALSLYAAFGADAAEQACVTPGAAETRWAPARPAGDARPYRAAGAQDAIRERKA